MTGRWVRGVAALALAFGVSGCVPMLVGSAVVGTTAVATDRRTTGMQVEDQSIELRVRNLVDTEFGDQVRVTPSSYNGAVLLLGSVPDEDTRARLVRLVGGLENVKSVTDRLELGLPRTVGAAANDSLITGQVRAALIATPDLSSNALVITTYRNTVYLQGRVTQAEGDLAARVASGLRGVNQVVTLFELISPVEAARYLNTTSPPELQTAGTGVELNQSTSAPAPVAPETMPAGSSSSPALAIPVPVAN